MREGGRFAALFPDGPAPQPPASGREQAANALKWTAIWLARLVGFLIALVIGLWVLGLIIATILGIEC